MVSCAKNLLLLWILLIGPVEGFKILNVRSPPRLRSCALSSKPSVSIEYCTGCKWLLRSAYFAQELLTTFESDLEEVILKPNSSKPGGVFVITVHTDMQPTIIWDRKNDDTPGFPETKVLKQRLRDVIMPNRNLGHSEGKVIEIPPES